ncbi:hypothetical protein KJ707_03340 [Patescibacteria group bacterium]|nr:hypothetical protein [Patescibacteria group bacterium]
MSNLLDPILEKALKKDKQNLERSSIPIVTISASYREDVKGMFGYPEDETIADVVFSRAHYSMAGGVAVKAWGKKMDHTKAWVVDPTNYVSHKDWNSIELTEDIGKIIARQPILKKLKDFVDQFGRSKLPILSSITPPLLHLTENITKPILSFHIAVGNILATQGRTVVQMITDPHVREEYLNHADRKNFYLLVFDDNTRTEVLEKASILEKKIDPDRVIVTGPPIDPRIINARKNKHPWRSGPLRLAITTGGLGTNKKEIKKLLQQFLPQLRKQPHPFELLIYAGTHQDIDEMVTEMARDEHVRVNELTTKNAKLRVIYHPQIVDANEMLIKYGFPWADGFISKPSGDMAYDAAASGSFILTLAEWGEWEHNVRETFEQLSIARKTEVEHIVPQLEALTRTQDKSQSWVELAMHQAMSIDKLFLEGAQNILKAYKKIKNLST